MDDSPAATAEVSPARSRSKWITVENKRVQLAMLAATLVGIVGSRVWSIWVDQPISLGPYAVLTGWTAFSAVHLLTTWLGYRGLAGEQLAEVLRSDRESFKKRSALAEWLFYGTSANSFTTSLALLPLIGLMVLVLYPDLRRDPVLLAMGVALVAVTWLDVSMTHAGHYARIDATEGGLTFSGEPRRAQDDTAAFSDYQYFAQAVQATFGTTDVSVTTTKMRTAVRQHGLLAFVFNSVIVALVVSLVLTLR